MQAQHAAMGVRASPALAPMRPAFLGKPVMGSQQAMQGSMQALTQPATGPALRARRGVLAAQQNERIEPLRVTVGGSQSKPVYFSDVAGCDGAKAELAQVVDFLRNPRKYNTLGAKMPKGVLLYGPPGTGKTLLARAVAGEAGVPFFSLSASEFVEMYVGLGAKRVRQLFDELRKNRGGCILFIDELDAVGRSRSPANAIGGNEERDQTINQLLTEMDGFQGTEGILVIAATNRKDVIDEALLRPGRFDRHINVSLPDVAGRLAILQVHGQRYKLDENVNLGEVALRAVHFSGADLAEVINQAAINAAGAGKPTVEHNDLLSQVERMVVGSPKGGAGHASAKIRQLVAYHEAGHALVASVLSDYSPVTKVTIVPQGEAGGYTAFEPTEEQLAGMVSHRFLNHELAVAMGGRAAEEVMLGRASTTTGAVNDFMQATQIATQMVQQLGFNDGIGPMILMPTSAGDMGTELRNRVDRQRLALVNRAHRSATGIIKKYKHVIQAVADVLLDKGTISGAELDAIVKKHIPKVKLKARAAIPNGALRRGPGPMGPGPMGPMGPGSMGPGPMGPMGGPQSDGYPPV